MIKSAMVGQRVLVHLPLTAMPVGPDGADVYSATFNGWRFGVAVSPPEGDHGQYIQVRDGSAQDGMVFEVLNYGEEPGEWCLPEDAPVSALQALPKDILILRLQDALAKVGFLESQIELLFDENQALMDELAERPDAE